MADFIVEVKTSDRFGAGTDSSVYLSLIDINGKKTEAKKLDAFFFNDFERGRIDKYELQFEAIGEVADLEIWREVWGVFDAWHLEYVSIENVETKNKSIFPFNRWAKPSIHYFVEQYDCTLPQYCKYKEQRKEEMIMRREMYKYKETFPKVPLQVQELPEDEKFSDTYKWDLSTHKLSLLMEKFWVGTTQVDKCSYFTELDQVIGMFDRFSSMPRPQNVENWKEDTYFGHQRMNGCNPELIALCADVPETFAVDPETLKPLLEDKTIEEAIQAKKLFIIDLTMLEGVSTADEAVLTSPYCLLYLRDTNELVPVAIQLFKEPSQTNPVFYPSDDANLWLLAKMWYCLADASYHQAAAHLGSTHLMMEGICVAMNKTMSLSHPVHRILAPHFLYLLAINDLALNKLVAPGGWIDLTMAIGRLGLLEIVAKRFDHYDISLCGDLMTDLKNRGVEDENVLPNYYYRDDAMILYDVIKNYVKKMVVLFYSDVGDIVKDEELQAWGKELITPKPDGLGYTGIPGDGKLSTHDDITTILTYIIFSCSVEHAAVNFSQYDSYAFPLGYPVRMRGNPPKNKSPVTENDIVETLNNKEHMMNTMVVTRMLSDRGTNALGDYEVNYIYQPDAVKIIEGFRAELKTAGATITARDAERKFPYKILNPAEIPNAISI